LISGGQNGNGLSTAIDELSARCGAQVGVCWLCGNVRHEILLDSRRGFAVFLTLLRDGSNRRENITYWALKQFRAANRDDDPEYIVRLVGQVVRVSVDTAEIVKCLPTSYGA